MYSNLMKQLSVRLWQCNAKLLCSRLNLDFDDPWDFLVTVHCSYVLGLGWWDSLGQFVHRREQLGYRRGQHGHDSHKYKNIYSI